MSAAKEKRAGHRATPTPTKEAKHSKKPDGYQDLPIAWHLQLMDNGGNWRCSLENIKIIKNRLHEYETLKWSEVLKPQSNHPLPVERICAAAKKRLQELKFGDIDSLYQLDIKGGNGKQRLWGIRRENIFQILWWDPEHTVYPTAQRHT